MPEALTTAMSTAFSTVSTNATSMISTAVPAALGVAGIVIVVRIGWRVFKSIARG